MKKTIFLLLFLINVSTFHTVHPITNPEETDVSDLTSLIGTLSIAKKSNEAPSEDDEGSGYSSNSGSDESSSADSDSEDGENYTYEGLPPIKEYDTEATEVMPSYRAIHLSPSTFNKTERSLARRKRHVGKSILSSAAYDLIGKKPTDEDLQKPINKSKDRQKLLESGQEIRDKIKNMPDEERNKFQQLYTNDYDKFHRSLKTVFDFPSSKNCQVSTSETARHPYKYGFGLKYLGKDVEKLLPKYDKEGKPKHPYLGKLYAMLISPDNLEKLSPYFVVHGHAQGKIKVSTHYANNILIEREESFPGLIPGKYVVYDENIRVPSFKGSYKSYYQEKYGISERSYKILQGKLRNGNFTDESLNNLYKKIIKHKTKQLEDHIEKHCKNTRKKLIYKSLEDGFCDTLPELPN